MAFIVTFVFALTKMDHNFLYDLFFDWKPLFWCKKTQSRVPRPPLGLGPSLDKCPLAWQWHPASQLSSPPTSFVLYLHPASIQSQNFISPQMLLSIHFCLSTFWFRCQKLQDCLMWVAFKWIQSNNMLIWISLNLIFGKGSAVVP